MQQQPAIIVSTRDLERLELLLENQANANLPGIDQLRKELARAKLVESADIPANVVTMNSMVRFIDDSSGSKFELTLVYPEAAGSAETVSVLAPVGSALLGLSVGQSISWQVPGGRKLQLRVADIVQQPEALGQLHR